MKKLSLLLCIALGLWACGDDDPTTEPVPAPGTETHAPAVKIEKVTPSENSVDIKFTVEDAEKAVYKVLLSNAAQPTAAELLADKEASPVNVAGETVQKSGLEINKEYVIVAAASYGETVSKLAVQTFKTETITFAVEFSNIKWNSAQYKITPSKETATYVHLYAKKADMDKYEGKDNEFLTFYIEYLEELAKTLPELTFADMLDTGVKGETLATLEEDAEYVVVAFGLTADKVVTTPLYKFDFRTTKFEVADDCTFEFEFSNVLPNNLDVKVTPSKETTRWYVSVSSAERLDEYTAEAWADRLILQETGYFGIDWAGDNYIYTGTRTLNVMNDLNLTELKPEQEYFAIAFGVDKKGVRTTRAFVSEMQKTPAPGTVTGLTIGINIDLNGTYGTAITYTPSDLSAGYMLGTFSKEEFTKHGATDEEFIQYFIDSFGYLLGYAYTGEYTDNVTYVGTVYPGEEYVTWAFGYTQEDGATTGLFKQEFTEPDRTSTPATSSLKSAKKKNMNFTEKMLFHF